MEHFRYPMHFLLLTGFCVLIGATSRLNLIGTLSMRFATYGVLHALALALSVQGRQPLWRLCLFIASAAALSVLTLHLALLAGLFFKAAPGNAASYSLLGLCAAIGAINYGILIRWCGLYALTVRALAGLSIICVSAALIALFAAGQSRFLGPWWIAASWWCGFSSGLWYFDRQNGAGNSTIGR
jgi:hypothetical protein